MKVKVLVYHSDIQEQESILQDLATSSFEVVVAGTPAVAQYICATYKPDVILVGEPLFPGGLELTAHLKSVNDYHGDAFPLPAMIAYQPCPANKVFDFKKAAETLGFYRLIPRWLPALLHGIIVRYMLDKADREVAKA